MRKEKPLFELTTRISQVAKEAGISVATVSRVINQKGGVTPETAQKVMQAIQRLGYQPNVWGRNLRRGESQVVLVMVPNVTNPYYASIIAGAEDTLSAAGYSIMLCITNMDSTRRGNYLDLMRNRRADGAILMDVAVDDRDMVQLAGSIPWSSAVNIALPRTSAMCPLIIFPPPEKRSAAWLLWDMPGSDISVRKTALFPPLSGMRGTNPP